MATTVTTRLGDHLPQPDTPPSSPQSLTLNTLSSVSFARVPNKHIPFCSPGPAPSQSLPSPPATPDSTETSSSPSLSILYPPHRFESFNDKPPVYALPAASLAEALEHLATQPLPDPALVFPWLHGLTSENQIQLSFFRGLTRNPVPPIPSCLRGITVVKVGGNLTSSKLKGAIAPDELLLPLESCSDKHASHCEGGPCFIDIDPLQGFSVRNFRIQCCKMATVSDIVVYGDDSTPRQEVESLALSISRAQATWQKKVDATAQQDRRFNTFLLADTFAKIETHYPELVACSSKGRVGERIMDFPHQERLEMAQLSKASEIAHNVYIGQTPDLLTLEGDSSSPPELEHDILVEASDFAPMPDAETLAEVETFLRSRRNVVRAVAQVGFPSSGSFGCRSNMIADISGLLGMCRWIHKMTNGGSKKSRVDGEHGAAKPTEEKERKLLIHCADGYTESSLLGLCYLMYAECLPAREAWIWMHRDKRRNFFAYPADKNFLTSIERRIMWESPSRIKNVPPAGTPIWAKRMDGSLPSRILPYLYLGNLSHAMNPGLLRQLGITHVLSVGEPVTWKMDPASVGEDASAWPEESFCYVEKVQDNGVDTLTTEFCKCLDFIAKAKAKGEATLVHCRVGVSRSATICIAEVMDSMQLSFPRAYCFVRARRLNVIIQPHLRFSYELLKWEEYQSQKRGVPCRREFEWATIAREIALMNKPYCRD